MFELFTLFFFVAFFSVLALIITQVVRGFKRERENDRSPRLTVDAKVVAKRTDFHRTAGDQHHVGHGHTAYFVTFQVKSGDRMELHLSGTEYGMLVEGDFGELTFQGTRYLGFARKAVSSDL